MKFAVNKTLVSIQDVGLYGAVYFRQDLAHVVRITCFLNFPRAKQFAQHTSSHLFHSGILKRVQKQRGELVIFVLNSQTMQLATIRQVVVPPYVDEYCISGSISSNEKNRRPNAWYWTMGKLLPAVFYLPPNLPINTFSHFSARRTGGLRVASLCRTRKIWASPQLSNTASITNMAGFFFNGNCSTSRRVSIDSLSASLLPVYWL